MFKTYRKLSVKVPTGFDLPREVEPYGDGQLLQPVRFRWSQPRQARLPYTGNMKMSLRLYREIKVRIRVIGLIWLDFWGIFFSQI